jgi:hypothetical protein
MRGVHSLFLLLLAVVRTNGSAWTYPGIDHMPPIICAASRSFWRIFGAAADVVHADGRRRLSFVHPTTTNNDDSIAASKNGAKDDDESTSETSSKRIGSIASRTSRVSNVKSLRRSSGKSDNTDSSTSRSTPASSEASKSSIALNNTSAGFMATNSSLMDKNITISTHQSAGSGEPPYENPLPTVYNYEDGDAGNTHVYKVEHPLNPVVDDILQFLDDDSYSDVKIFPKEKHQPAIWPLICLGIFTIAAVVLCATTAYRNYSKRKNYQELPTSLNV